MYKLIFLFVFGFLMACSPKTATELTTPGSAINQPTIPIEKADVPDLKKLDDYLTQKIEEGVIPGGVFYLSHKGKPIYHKAFGNISEARPYAETDFFRIASMTKAVTTIAILQLYEQGKLGLDDTLEKYLPAFKDPVVLETFNDEDGSYTTTPASSSITIRHLLTHTSGIYYSQFIDGYKKKVYEQFGLDKYGITSPGTATIPMANNIAKAPLAHEPGSRWTYGLNMEVLGAVVEQISGQTLGEYFDEHIFGPIGAEDIHFYLPPAKSGRLAPLYTYDEAGKLKASTEMIWGFPMLSFEKASFHGGGGLSATALAYSKVIQALHNKGEYNGQRILSEETIELMVQDHTSELTAAGMGVSKNEGVSFCLGHRLVTKRNKEQGPWNTGTISWGGYFNSKWWSDPVSDLVFVGMTNVLPFPYEDFWSDMYEVLYENAPTSELTQSAAEDQ